jgi:hypothetical protein
MYSETKGKTLEEIAEVFGDHVAFTEYVGAAGIGATVTRKEANLAAAADEVEHDSIKRK